LTMMHVWCWCRCRLHRNGLLLLIGFGEGYPDVPAQIAQKGRRRTEEI
jgi:hypothetical protein